MSRKLFKVEVDFNDTKEIAELKLKTSGADLDLFQVEHEVVLVQERLRYFKEKYEMSLNQLYTAQQKQEDLWAVVCETCVRSKKERWSTECCKKCGPNFKNLKRKEEVGEDDEKP